MYVTMTQELRASLARDGLDGDELIERFTKWKSGDEYGSYYFGKDSAYVRPHVDGKPYQLRHVHTVPLQDQDALRRWKTVYRRRGRKTSDRVLVYTADGKDGFLLIYVLEEPTAHEIANMKTVEDTEIMEGFAEVAAAFIDNGDVIA